MLKPFHLLLTAGAAALTACSPLEVTAVHAPRYTKVLIEDVPHLKQKPDLCGEACAAMVLSKLGFTHNQDWVFKQTGVDPALGRGAWTRELKRGCEKIGFEVGPVWHKVAAQHAPRELEALWAALHTDLLRGVPSIVCTRFDEQPDTTEHFRLILGYDADKDAVIYHEPARSDGAYMQMSRARFLSLWPLKYKAQEWTVVRLRLKPSAALTAKAKTRREVKAQAASRPTAAPGFTEADYAQHLADLEVPAGFTVLIKKPFVIIGDEPADVVRRRANGTVKWAVDHLKALYFSQDPKRILNIWLFKDRVSYEKHCRSLFGHEPDTPYGYYSSSAHALIMNIATGGGTLVHEIVHPFMESNFPKVPAWFNEGLGSLYEQSAGRNGKIVGLTNWRLAGLQEAIRAGLLPSFHKLTHTTEREFYDSDPGSNYAQARYLCYYLQERSLLTQFYRDFRANQASDPSGYQTLISTLGEKDMAAFQQRWQRWVLTLRFP